ncbi:MAG: sel1 repeat family protein [Akkermansiaceae bacterium]|nr:sel1 repeat family protein [Akkermansiaceae bacterium]
MRLRAVILFLILLIGYVGAADEASDYVPEFVDLQMDAMQGDAEAQYLLARAYQTGTAGAPVDMEEAVRWYRQAAISGHPRAQCGLAKLYVELEDATWEDYETAEKWFRAAAAQGDEEGMLGMGLLRMEGRGVAENKAEAVLWFRCAAGLGLAEAQYYLGLAYEEGSGVTRDSQKALEWYSRAADQGHAEAQARKDKVSVMHHESWEDLLRIAQSLPTEAPPPPPAELPQPPPAPPPPVSLLSRLLLSWERVLLFCLMVGLYAAYLGYVWVESAGRRKRAS